MSRLEREAVEYADNVEEKKHRFYVIDSNVVFTREEVEHAYIAGAKENGTQIHKTSELDFPEDGSEVLCFGKMWNGTPYKAVLKYDGCFHDENGTPYEPEIKAWCEIPKFEEQG